MSESHTYHHITELLIDLSALEQNVAYLQDQVREGVELMPVIKADAYGSGVYHIASKLQEIGIKYFAVAIIEEAIELRNKGLDTTILVLYPDRITVEAAWEYDFHIEVYSMDILKVVQEIAIRRKKMVNIHIKIDTGMHRMGFLPDELEEVVQIAEDCQYINVAGVMSHMASSENERDDAFSQKQIALFDKCYNYIENNIGSSPKRHIQNSGGILRFSLPYEIARVGISLYGIDPRGIENKELKKVHTLQARIIQIKDIGPGETVSYNRNTTLSEGGRIGIVNIGYADGLPRRLGNRGYKVSIKGRQVDIIGNICMDSIIVDLTGHDDVNTYDEVEIFGHKRCIEELADRAGTIPYEILCGLSNRLKRIYIDA